MWVKRLARYVPILVGVALFGATFTTLWKNVLFSKTINEKAVRELSSDLVYEQMIAPGEGPDIWERVETTLIFRIQHPRSVTLSESFIVRAQMEIADARVYQVVTGFDVYEKLLIDLSEKDRV